MWLEGSGKGSEGFRVANGFGIRAEAGVGENLGWNWD